MQVSHDLVHQGMGAASRTRTTIHVFEQNLAAHHVRQQTARSQEHLRALQMG